MENWFVAKSYENDTIVSEPFDNNKGKKMVKVKHSCDRCFGTGNYGPAGVFNGICFECGGRGYVIKEVRAYTEKERAQLDRAAVRREEKKQEEKEEARRIDEKNSDRNLKDWFSKNGFNSEGVTWAVGGCNTFAIKEELKAEGGRFNQILKWHFDHDITEEFPNCTVKMFRFGDLYEWNCYTKAAYPKEGAIEQVEADMAPAPNTTSTFVGEVKERLRDMSVTLISKFSFDGSYGTTNILKFEDNNKNIFVWFTTSYQDIAVGDPCLLTGTVKEHKEYKGENTTVLTRCKINIG